MVWGYDGVLQRYILLFFFDKKSKQKSQGKTKLSPRSVIRQELQPKLDKPLRRNSKPYHIHADAGPQFCRAGAQVLIGFCRIFIAGGFERILMVFIYCKIVNYCNNILPVVILPVLCTFGLVRWFCATNISGALHLFGLGDFYP